MSAIERPETALVAKCGTSAPSILNADEVSRVAGPTVEGVAPPTAHRGVVSPNTTVHALAHEAIHAQLPDANEAVVASIHAEVMTLVRGDPTLMDLLPG